MDYLLVIFIIILLGILSYYLVNNNDYNYAKTKVKYNNNSIINTNDDTNDTNDISDNNHRYVNDIIIPRKSDNNANYEYIQQFDATTSKMEPINPNSIGFCPKARDEKKALPIANLNVNFLLQEF